MSKPDWPQSWAQQLQALNQAFRAEESVLRQSLQAARQREAQLADEAQALRTRVDELDASLGKAQKALSQQSEQRAASESALQACRQETALVKTALQDKTQLLERASEQAAAAGEALDRERATLKQAVAHGQALEQSLEQERLSWAQDRQGLAALQAQSAASARQESEALAQHVDQLGAALRQREAELRDFKAQASSAQKALLERAVCAEQGLRALDEKTKEQLATSRGEVDRLTTLLSAGERRLGDAARSFERERLQLVAQAQQIQREAQEAQFAAQQEALRRLELGEERHRNTVVAHAALEREWLERLRRVEEQAAVQQLQQRESAARAWQAAARAEHALAMLRMSSERRNTDAAARLARMESEGHEIRQRLDAENQRLEHAVRDLEAALVDRGREVQALHALLASAKEAAYRCADTAAAHKSAAADAAPVGQVRFLPDLPALPGTATTEFNSKATMDHVHELINLQDSAFVDAAYRALLGRDPEPAGRDHFLARLRRDGDKVAILSALAQSEEGRQFKPVLGGLDDVLASSRQGVGRLRSWLNRIWRIELGTARLEASQGHQALAASKALSALQGQVEGLKQHLFQQIHQQFNQLGTQVHDRAARLESSVSSLAQLVEATSARLAEAESARNREHAHTEASLAQVAEAIEQLVSRFEEHASAPAPQPPVPDSGDALLLKLDGSQPAQALLQSLREQLHTSGQAQALAHR